jgi:hypothetical protein
MVFCFVVGTKITNAFRVRGEAVMTIDELREMIYEKNRNDFTSKGFDANKLDLWKVNIPGDAENAKNLKPLESRRDIDDENVIIKNLGGKELTPFENFGDIFENDYNDSKNIRIIAQPPPPPATTGKCLPMVYTSRTRNSRCLTSYIFFFYSIRKRKTTTGIFGRRSNL